ETISSAPLLSITASIWMLYGFAPGARPWAGAAGTEAVSESSSDSFSLSGAGRLTAGAAGTGFKRTTVAGDVRAAGDISPTAGAGGVTGSAGSAGAGATDGEAAAADDISATGAGFSPDAGALGKG